MADELGIEVTAEGVEVPEQRDLLLEMGCRSMQGFLFGQAVPGPSFGAVKV
jgi:EAL domain-containing protein (putative c-di-GMP-specific phosphodiesterase class I)